MPPTAARWHPIAWRFFFAALPEENKTADATYSSKMASKHGFLFLLPWKRKKHLLLNS
jgi:hypothetical protein